MNTANLLPSEGEREDCRRSKYHLTISGKGGPSNFLLESIAFRWIVIIWPATREKAEHDRNQ